MTKVTAAGLILYIPHPIQAITVGAAVASIGFLLGGAIKRGWL